MNATASSFDIFPHVKAYGLPAKTIRTVSTNIENFYPSAETQSTVWIFKTNPVTSIVYTEILLTPAA